MTAKPWMSPHAFAVLARYTTRELGQSLPLKSPPAREMPLAWKLALMGAALRILTEDSNRPNLDLHNQDCELEPPFAPVLKECTEDSEVSGEIGDNG